MRRTGGVPWCVMAASSGRLRRKASLKSVASFSASDPGAVSPSLQPDQLRAQHLRQHLGDLGLADPRVPFDEQGLSQRGGEEDRRGDLPVGDVRLALHHVLDPANLFFHRVDSSEGAVASRRRAGSCRPPNGIAPLTRRAPVIIV